ncbi:MAG TPA: hypothetical protein VKR42_05475 [Ktedonobacteraceae bacterium]|nr:hypothetical protein [Ktedonobacteraceae bacterium]
MAIDFATLEAVLPNMSNEQKKEVAVKVLSPLPNDAKTEIAAQSGFPLPSREPTDIIWLVVIISFAVILIVVAGALVFGVIFLQRTADNVQIILTIFTTEVAFLAGLLSPSPMQGNKSNG